MKKPLALNPPEWLADEAVGEWARVLGLPGVEITPRMVAVLAAYCQNWARWVESERMLAEHGCEVVLRDDKGVVKSVGPSPWIGIGAKAHDRMLKAARDLGLTSCGSAQVRAPKADAAVVGEAASSAAREWFGDLN